jgi:hypothetical protein
MGSDDLSTGSRSDHTENEECGDFDFLLDVQNNDSSESLNDSNNESHGIKACGAAGALGVSRPSSRPQSPVLGKHIFQLYQPDH